MLMSWRVSMPCTLTIVCVEVHVMRGLEKQLPQVSEIVSRCSIQNGSWCAVARCVTRYADGGWQENQRFALFWNHWKEVFRLSYNILEGGGGGASDVSWPARSPSWLPSFVLLPPRFGYPSGDGETSPGEETRKYSKPGLLWLLVTMLYNHRT